MLSQYNAVQVAEVQRVVNISIVIAVGSFVVSIAAFIRAGRNYAEEQRDKLLAQISNLAIEAWKQIGRAHV